MKLFKVALLALMVMFAGTAMAGTHVSVNVGVGGYYGGYAHVHGYYHDGYRNYYHPPVRGFIVVDPVPPVVYTTPRYQYVQVERVCYDAYGYRYFCGYEWIRP